ncbi:uncharacterized protein MONBRDRAFT_23471 [Monosiga brevicollis MX1]|uniref:BAH domain-containing protein n=1 Tax=Monosiga brevicollis TaxID=81824 RepID=A9UTI4_MONBE|nr:uncharacterized protein MONBRDRAFT_23471 [Monosiga brevicollis MX1]EDQ91252.1 predicted protein [Monosiga brevicollis MX1]|eukprot:XP_001743674.1 hypothetical protein [Monosiga brevicollis MX1]
MPLKDSETPGSDGKRETIPPRRFYKRTHDAEQTKSGMKRAYGRRGARPKSLPGSEEPLNLAALPVEVPFEATRVQLTCCVCYVSFMLIFRRTPKDAAIFYNNIRFGETLLTTDSTVLLRAAEAPKPYVARIVRMLHDTRTDTQHITVTWLLRPEETRRGRQPHHGEVPIFFLRKGTKVGLGSAIAPRTRARRTTKASKPTATSGAPKASASSRSSRSLRQEDAQEQETSRTESSTLGHRRESRARYSSDQMQAKAVSVLAAIQEGDDETLSILMMDRTNLNVALEMGMTPLAVACAHGQNKIVRGLLRRGCRLDLVDDFGNTPLHHAARINAASLVRQLLRAGANTQIRNRDGKLPRDLTSSRAIRHNIDVASTAAA